MEDNNTKMGDSLGNSSETKIPLRQYLREGYSALISTVLFIICLCLWGWLGSKVVSVENFEEMLIFMSSFIIPTYVSVIIPPAILGERSKFINTQEEGSLGVISPHGLERNTFVVFALAPLIMSLYESVGIVIFLAYFTVVGLKMYRQSVEERATAIIRITAIISIWLSLVWAALHASELKLTY